MAIIFTCYSRVNNTALKWIISNSGSVYFMAVILLFMFYGIRSLNGLIARLILGKEKTDEYVSGHPLIAGRITNSILLLIISLVITSAGFIRIDDIKVREYALSISKPSDIKELDINNVRNTLLSG